MQYRNEEYEAALESCDRLIENGQTLLSLNRSQRHVERSELANYFFLKGQCMERLGKPKEEIITLQDEAIELEELNARISPDKKRTPLLAKLYRVKAQLLQVLDGRFDDSLEATKKAVDVYRELGNDKEAAMLEMLLKECGYGKKKPAGDGETTDRKDTVDDYKEKEEIAEEGSGAGTEAP